jgi:hypothetical protein
MPQVCQGGDPNANDNSVIEGEGGEAILSGAATSTLSPVASKFGSAELADL